MISMIFAFEVGPSHIVGDIMLFVPILLLVLFPALWHSQSLRLAMGLTPLPCKTSQAVKSTHPVTVIGSVKGI